MTHVSRNKLRAEQFDELYDKLNILIGALDAKKSQFFFNELLGKEEKIMLVKRLGAVAMFQEEHTPYRVSQALLISPSTAARIKLNFENGAYEQIVTILTKNKLGYKKFWETLESILNAGFPPRGRGRWKKTLELLKK